MRERKFIYNFLKKYMGTKFVIKIISQNAEFDGRFFRAPGEGTTIRRDKAYVYSLDLAQSTIRKESSRSGCKYKMVPFGDI